MGVVASQVIAEKASARTWGTREPDGSYSSALKKVVIASGTRTLEKAGHEFAGAMAEAGAKVLHGFAVNLGDARLGFADGAGDPEPWSSP